MKKYLLPAMLLVACCGCNKEMPDMGETDIVLQPMSCTLAEGQTRQLTVSQGTASEWYSDNSAVATVSTTGLVTAQTLPDDTDSVTVKIAARVESRTATCTVLVIQAK